MEVSAEQIKLVATDGHRLALSEHRTEVPVSEAKQIIIPRKAVLELSRLLENNDSVAKIILSQNHIRVETGDLLFTSKLIDGHFPDYQRVIPKNADKRLLINRDLLRQALTRTSILSNEKYRGKDSFITINYDRLKKEDTDKLVQSLGHEHFHHRRHHCRHQG